MGKPKRKKGALAGAALADDEKRLLERVREEFERAPDPRDDEAVRRVLDLAGKSERLALAVAEEAASFPRPFVLRVLREMERNAAAKPLRKAVRHSRFLLERRGVEWKEGEEGKARGGVYRPEKKEPYGLVTAVDTAGARLVVLVRPKASGGLQVALAVLDEEQGIRDFRDAHMTPGDLKRVLKESSKDDMPFVRTSAGHVCLLFQESAALMAGKGKDPPPGYAEWKSWISRYEPLPSQPPIFDRVPRESLEQRSSYPARVDELLEDPYIVGWIPRPPETAAYVQKLQEVKNSPLILTPQQQAQRSRWILEEAVQALFPPERRKRMRKRLEETAYVLWEEGKKDLARIAAAVSLEVERPHELAPESSFLVELVRRSFLLAEWEAGEGSDGEEESDSPLILGPREGSRWK